MSSKPPGGSTRIQSTYRDQSRTSEEAKASSCWVWVKAHLEGMLMMVGIGIPADVDRGGVSRQWTKGGCSGGFEGWAASSCGCKLPATAADQRRHSVNCKSSRILHLIPPLDQGHLPPRSFTCLCLNTCVCLCISDLKKEGSSMLCSRRPQNLLLDCLHCECFSVGLSPS